MSRDAKPFTREMQGDNGPQPAYCQMTFRVDILIAMRAKKCVLIRKLKIISVMHWCAILHLHKAQVSSYRSRRVSRIFLALGSTASCADCKRVATYIVIFRPLKPKTTQFGYYQRTNIISQGSAGNLCSSTYPVVLPLSILPPILAPPYRSLTTWLAYPIL